MEEPTLHVSKSDPGHVQNVVSISMEEEAPIQVIPDSKQMESEEVTVKDSSTQNRNLSKFAVFRMQIVSDFKNTRIDGTKRIPVRDDITGFKRNVQKKVFVYQAPAPYPAPYPPPEAAGMGRGGDDRNDFIMLTFLICGIMLITVFAFTFTVYFTPAIANMMRKTVIGLGLFAICSILIMLVSYAYCCFDCSRQPPINWCLNIIVTLCFAYVCGFICARYAPFVVFGALITTIVIVAVCLGLAFTSFDFTKFMFIVAIAMLAVTIASIFCSIIVFAFKVKLGPVRIILTIISSVLISVMLVIEFQMILGGKSVELEESEYVYGAYLIFTSIISLFIKMVRIIGYFSSND